MPDTQATRDQLAKASEEAHQLTESVNALTTKFDANVSLTEKVQRLGRLLLILVVITLAGGVVGGIYVYNQQKQIKNFLVDGTKARDSIERINDCLIPSGVCYKEQRKEQGAIVLAIIDTNHNGKPDTAEILAALERIDKGN